MKHPIGYAALAMVTTTITVALGLPTVAIVVGLMFIWIGYLDHSDSFEVDP